MIALAVAIVFRWNEQQEHIYLTWFRGTEIGQLLVLRSFRDNGLCGNVGAAIANGRYQPTHP